MKKNVVIVILVMLVLGLGGYLVYDKVIDKEVEKENKEEAKEEITSEKDNNNQENNNVQLKNYNVNDIKDIVVEIPENSNDGPERKSITITNKEEIKNILIEVDEATEIGHINEGFGYVSNVAVIINYEGDPSTGIIFLDSGNIAINSAIGVGETSLVEYEIKNKNLSSELINKYKN